jgi:hypothetical protein
MTNDFSSKIQNKSGFKTDNVGKKQNISKKIKKEQYHSFQLF